MPANYKQVWNDLVNYIITYAWKNYYNGKVCHFIQDLGRSMHVQLEKWLGTVDQCTLQICWFIDDAAEKRQQNHMAILQYKSIIRQF